AAAAAAILALIGSVGWYAGGQLRTPARRALVFVVFVVALSALALRVHQQSFGVDFRREFYAASWRMIAARPLFGVGVGQYFAASALFFSPLLAFTYGFENAHNNFLQFAGELGVVGFALFGAWVAAAFVQAARAIPRVRDARLLGAATGALAFVVTWLASHP